MAGMRPVRTTAFHICERRATLAVSPTDGRRRFKEKSGLGIRCGYRRRSKVATSTLRRRAAVVKAAERTAEKPCAQELCDAICMRCLFLTADDPADAGSLAGDDSTPRRPARRESESGSSRLRCKAV